MKQKFILVDGLKLAYLERNAHAEKILFFIHGNSSSARSWKKQLESEVLSDYTLIAFDLPAHGDSGASERTAEDYCIPGLAAIIAKAVTSLAGDFPYLLVGLSLGTNIIAETLMLGLNPAGMVLAGSCIGGGKITTENFIKPDTHIFVVFSERSSEAELEIYASEAMFTSDKENVEAFITDYYNVKPLFRPTLFHSIQELKYNDEIELVQRYDKPLLLIFGLEEKIINPDYLDHVPLKVWNDAIYKLSGASHLVNVDQSQAFNQLLADYAEAMFNKSDT